MELGMEQGKYFDLSQHSIRITTFNLGILKSFFCVCYRRVRVPSVSNECDLGLRDHNIIY